MNGKQAKRIRREVMETFPAANLPDRLVEVERPRPVYNSEGTFIGYSQSPLKWHNTTQRTRYQEAKDSYKNRLKEIY